MKRKLIVLILLLSVFLPAFSRQTAALPFPARSKVDSLVMRLMNAAGVTGLALGIVRNGEVELVKSYGYKNKARAQLNDTNTVFYAASFAKTVFAWLVMQLADKNVIDLDTPLCQYLPKPLPSYSEFRDLAGDNRWKLITARHCLSHTTGLPNWRQLNPNGTQKLQLFFKPGTRYAYSGEGLYLLQFVIEKVTKQKLETLAQKMIFKPFSMHRTSFVWQPSFNSNYAIGHNHDEDTVSIIKRTTANAAGSMQTTIADYTRFMAQVMQGKGLSGRSTKEVFNPQIRIHSSHQFPTLNNDTTGKYNDIQLSYGLGWGLFESNYGRCFFKEGHSDDGWEHYSIGMPDKQFALVIMTNSVNGESIFKELVEKLTGILIPWEWEGYMPYQPTVAITEKTVAPYLGEYTGRIRARILFENGRLKMEALAEGLQKTPLYPSTDTSFFMRSLPIHIEFIRQPDGKVILRMHDDSEVYDLSKK